MEQRAENQTTRKVSGFELWRESVTKSVSIIRLFSELEGRLVDR